MKKYICLVFFICLVFAATQAKAQTCGAFSYRLTKDLTAEITRYTGSDTFLTIPSMLDEYTVTHIGKKAFSNCDTLTSITIPSSVTVIGESAFEACYELKSVSIPESVTFIGETPFDTCLSLAEIKVSQNNPVFESIDNVLFNKEKRELLCYPGEKKQNAYSIPNGTKKISDHAFQSCGFLHSIFIPESVTDLGRTPFELCVNIYEFEVSPNNPVYSVVDDALINTIEKKLVRYPTNSMQARNYSIPDGIVSIGDGAFEGCAWSLASVSIPDSVTTIGNNAFHLCFILSSITIPDSVTTIGAFAFESCHALSFINLSDNLTSIENHTFSGCIALPSITIPDSVTEINHFAFSSCDNLTFISLPKGLKKISELAFISTSSDLVFSVPSGSYAEEWCNQNNQKFVYSDAND